jgi:protease-4
VRRGVAAVLSLIVFATVVSIAGLAVVYLMVGREPAVARNSTLVLRVSGDLSESPDDWLGLVRARRTPTLRGLVENLRKAKVDARISRVTLVVVNLQTPFWGRLQEVRDAVVDFKRSGKPIVAHLEYGGESEYYVATACDRILLLPTSPLDLDGVATYDIFFRGTLDKIGAYPDLHHIGAYKTASNALTEKGYTAAHREMSESLNRDMYDQLVRAIAEGRKKTEADVRRLLDEGPFLPAQAVEQGLIDGLAYEDEVDDQAPASGRQTRRIDGEDYGRVSAGAVGLNRGPRIAVLNALGTINSGRSGFDPGSGAVVGSDTFTEWVRDVREDASVRALVVRIDSPGGSAVASDVMWRELTVARKQKPDRPIVASMSDLAASGGYYLAMAASDIVAQPATLTGSIGIYGGKIVTGGTFNKLGITLESVSDGKQAQMSSPIRPYNKAEAAKVEEQLRAFYDAFVRKVAESRRMTPEAIDAVAQGRVWTGRQAKEIGLVDALGGLDRAIAIAKERARIPANAEVEVEFYPPRRSVYDLLTSSLMGMDARVDVRAWLAPAERRAMSTLAAPLSLFRRGEPLALMPLVVVR